MDRFSSPRCSFPERLFFRAWSNPVYRSTHLKSVEITGDQIITGVRFGGVTIPCDGLMICGDLIPNTELVMQGKLKADAVTRIPFVTDDFELSQPGWFGAGNILGGFHGAEWCYFNGFKAARQLIKNRKL
jgi:thioredoxin reductase